MLPKSSRCGARLSPASVSARVTTRPAARLPRPETRGSPWTRRLPSPHLTGHPISSVPPLIHPESASEAAAPRPPPAPAPLTSARRRRTGASRRPGFLRPAGRWAAALKASLALRETGARRGRDASRRDGPEPRRIRSPAGGDGASQRSHRSRPGKMGPWWNGTPGFHPPRSWEEEEGHLELRASELLWPQTPSRSAWPF